MKTNVNLNAHHSNTQRDSNENESLLPRNPVPVKSRSLEGSLSKFAVKHCCSVPWKMFEMQALHSFSPPSLYPVPRTHSQGSAKLL